MWYLASLCLMLGLSNGTRMLPCSTDCHHDPMAMRIYPPYGSGPDCFRVAVITDAHVRGTPESGDSSALLLQKAVQMVNDSIISKNIRLVMITGDICEPSSSASFVAAKAILDGLNCPYVPLAGNHDVGGWTSLPTVDENLMGVRGHNT